eukprot:00176_2
MNILFLNYICIQDQISCYLRLFFLIFFFGRRLYLNIFAIKNKPNLQLQRRIIKKFFPYVQPSKKQMILLRKLLEIFLLQVKGDRCSVKIFFQRLNHLTILQQFVVPISLSFCSTNFCIGKFDHILMVKNFGDQKKKVALFIQLHFYMVR